MKESLESYNVIFTVKFAAGGIACWCGCGNVSHLEDGTLSCCNATRHSNPAGFLVIYEYSPHHIILHHDNNEEIISLSADARTYFEYSSHITYVRGRQYKR